MAHSASSSDGADAWAAGYSGSDDAAEMAYASDQHDIVWDHGADDMLMLLKAEPLDDDDDFCIDDFKEAPSELLPATGILTSTQPKVKRPRGRPRKHPLVPSVAANKITKGRSKTGCLTCRKRKKKCDEAKPRCEWLFGYIFWAPS